MRHAFVPIILLALCTIFITAPVHAVVIDNFQTTQIFFITSPPTTSPGFNGSVIGPASNIVGTERDVRFDVVGTTPITPVIGGGILNVSSGAGNSLTATLQWDGTLDSPKYDIDALGLSLTDLTDGGPSDSIAANIINGSAPVTAIFTVWADGGSGTVPSINQQVIGSGYNGIVVFSFEDFLTPVDFSEVTAMQLELQIGLNGQLTLSLLESIDFVPIAPEPSGLTLLAPFLIGLLTRRRMSLAKAQAASTK